MKRFVASIAIALFLILTSQHVSKAQSPIQCGLLNEPCCNLAGSSPNSCKTGLTCSGGVCISDGTTTDLPERGEVDPSLTPTEGKEPGMLCDDKVKLNTAIGCINILEDIDTSMGGILGLAIGIGGGIAFLLILYAGFMIMTSQGNPDRLKAGQELLTSAISGLILLIFSVFILRFIGVDILKLENFGFGK